MQDFDSKRLGRLGREEDELTFKLADREFVIKAGVRPEVWVAYWDAFARFSTLTNTEQLRAMDEHMVTILEEDYVEAWHEARGVDGPMAVTFDDIVQVVNWAWETQSARPTGAPSDSSERRDATTTPSTVA